MVMDFGLVEPMGYRASRISGTLAYLCPEVIQGKPVDARSDLYSLGVMAYEMITGCLPFVGERAEEILEAHLHQAASPLPLRQQNVPEAMERLILRLLEKNPDDRYQEAAAVSRELGRLMGASEAEASLENKKSYLYCAGLIGRDEEFGELTTALKQLKDGAGGCTFITAPAGVGKSRLLQEFRLRAQLTKVPFLLGQCRSQSGGSFEPFTDLFKGLLALTPAHRVASYEILVHRLLNRLGKPRLYQLYLYH